MKDKMRLLLAKGINHVYLHAPKNKLTRVCCHDPLPCLEVHPLPCQEKKRRKLPHDDTALELL